MNEMIKNFLKAKLFEIFNCINIYSRSKSYKETTTEKTVFKKLVLTYFVFYIYQNYINSCFISESKETLCHSTPIKREKLNVKKFDILV